MNWPIRNCRKGLELEARYREHLVGPTGQDAGKHSTRAKTGSGPVVASPAKQSKGNRPARLADPTAGDATGVRTDASRKSRSRSHG